MLALLRLLRLRPPVGRPSVQFDEIAEDRLEGLTPSVEPHGIPLVRVPIRADGFMNAERCEETGVGRSVAARELQPGMIGDAVLAILDQPAYPAAAERAQAQIAEMPEPSDVVHAIEALA